MKISKSDVLLSKADALCTTTNGIVTVSGKLVLGGGNALAFARKYPVLPEVLGHLAKLYGNHCFLVSRLVIDADQDVISFPTKNHYKDPSLLSLVERSAKELVQIVDFWKIKSVALAAPGIGLGGLNWERQVEPMLQVLLDNRFTVHFLE